MVIFFDAILVYSPSLHEHVLHLKLVSDTIRANKLFLNQAKCHLGHIISQGGVSTDPTKIKIVSTWTQPQTLKQLRGFLGLAGYYYWRFVKFGKIDKLFGKFYYDLLKKFPNFQP
jgi:hypothetical protein